MMIPQSPRPRHQYIVRGTDGIQEILDKLSHGILATDTETSGLDWWTDRVGGLSFAAGNTSAFFCKSALGTAARWFGDQVKQRRPLVFHGGKFDMHMIRETFGIHIAYPVHDTLIMSRLLDNRGAPTTKFIGHTYSHDLDKLAEYYVDPNASKSYAMLLDAIHAKLGGKRSNKMMRDWLIAPMSIYGNYGGLDPWYTLRLYDQFKSMIAHWPQPPGYPSLQSLYENERWLLLALRDMEERGVMIDQEYIHTWLDEATLKLEKLENKMNRRSGYDLNWRSIPQVRELFFDELEIQKVNGDSLDKRTLLKMHHPLAALLLKHRKLAKTVSAGRSLLKNIKSDGALHSWYNQNVDTGRMSATQGLHQFAKDSGVRKGVVPRRKRVIRSADYSQIEMRFAAHYSEEETLIEGFLAGGINFDTHAALAARMFGVKKPSDKQRDRGKTMNFAMLYGAGEDAVTEQLIERISAEEARQSCIELGERPALAESPFRKLAQLLRNAVRASYPKVWKFTKDEEEIAKAFGFVVDAFGYHRWLDEEEAYKAMNTKLQGSAAHQAKVGMVNVYREVQLGTGEIGIIMQIHDDIVYESAGDPRTDAQVLELLENRDSFKVPILADLKGSSKNWLEKEKIKLEKAA
jgi:DNA polymerase-1